MKKVMIVCEPPPAPDLQALVQQYGGYWQIPADVMTEHQAKIAAWRDIIRRGEHYHRALVEIEDEGENYADSYQDHQS